jgi:dihydroneopterin triphosphate diphosphatase
VPSVVKSFKLPISVLVVIHTPDKQVLLLERADHPGYWQSVTGSLDHGETTAQAAIREVAEETGIDATQYQLKDWDLNYTYEIYPEWRHRYAPGVTENREHVFSLLVPATLSVIMAPREHINCIWLPHTEAANKVFSPSNASAIRKLPDVTY